MLVKNTFPFWAFLVASTFGYTNASDFDFDGDGLADIGVNRPSNGAHYIKNSGGNFNSTRGDGIQRYALGRSLTDVPVSGDFDGDGIRDVGVRRPATAEWIIQLSSTGEQVTQVFGRRSSDVPVPADYDGDGITDLAVYRTDNLTWYIKNSSGVDNLTYNNDGISRQVFGERRSDFPVPADYDGDGKADLAIRQAETSNWIIRNSSGNDLISGNEDGNTRYSFGKRAEDIPVPADFDGDGRADLAVRRPSSKVWYILNSSGTDLLTGNPDGITRRTFGKRSEDIPVVADYDGDGRADIAVRRPSSKLWYVLNSSGIDAQSDNADGISRLKFGLRTTDIPLAQQSYKIFYEFDFDDDGLNNGQELSAGTDLLATDSDNDGIPDAQDAFPTDASEYEDSDGDGVGDNSDLYPDDPNEAYDSDGDGVGDNADAYPEDTLCNLLQDGDGEDCYLRLLNQDRNNLITFKKPGELLIYSPARAQILPIDIASNNFGEPVNLTQDSNAIAFHYSQSNQLLYVAWQDGEVGYFDENYQYTTFLSNLSLSTYMKTIGNFLLLSDSYNIFVYDPNGVMTSQVSLGWPVIDSVWEADENSLYVHMGENYYGYMSKWNFDSDTGSLSLNNYVYFNSEHLYSGPMFVLESEPDVFFIGDSVFAKSDLSYLTQWHDLSVIDIELVPENDEFITLAYQGGKSRLGRYESSFRELDFPLFDGAPLDIARDNSNITVLTQELHNLRLTSHPLLEDIDGDGIDNDLDAFPADIAASVDSDQDGYPDNWNVGFGESDSSNGLSLDVFPEDEFCWLESHDDGDGNCNYGAILGDFNPVKLAVDDAGTIYMLGEESNFIQRWSAESQTYLAPLEVGETGRFSNSIPITMIWSSEHQRLYLGYSNGAITFVDGDGTETDYYQLSSAASSLVPAGNFLVARSGYHYRAPVVSIDINGVEAGSLSSSYSSLTNAWNANNNRYYHFSDGISPNDLYYKEVDQNTGEFGASGESPYHGDYRIFGPIRISADGSEVLLGSGDIYDASDLTWRGNVGELDDALWLEGNELLKLNQSTQSITLQRRDSSNRTVESLNLEGQLVGALSTGEHNVIIHKASDELQFSLYVPNDDTDGDGVENTEDAFPTDAAASLDSDNDGYPDSWNEGYSEEDSTTGLTLDVFPEDAACWLESHDDGSGGCDYSATMPEFVPDEILADVDGTVYLFSETNGKVYTWSADTQQYQNPYALGNDTGFSTENPDSIAYSEAHQRLYFGYESGRITFIDLTGSRAEQEFTQLPQVVDNLAMAGNFLIARSGGYYNSMLHAVDENGIQTDELSSHYFSEVTAWNAQNQRLYHFRDRTSPNDLLYREVDQTTGLFGSSDDSPYHGDYSIRGPIRVSLDGSKVLLGSGDIYDADDLTWQGNVGTLSDALWLDNDELIKLTQSQSSLSLVRSDSSNRTIETQSLTGELQGIVRAAEHNVIVTQVNGELTFTLYEPNNDTDGDGVENTEDAFPTDVAASIDIDNDGYPDSWNEGYSEEDSTTGLTLDVFPEDAACWLDSHDDGSGGCDYSATMPEFVPDEILADVNGTVYLFSETNSKVYTWSAQTQQYQNPYSVGSSNGLTNEAPHLMAYSEAHSRLYFGYRSGQISYIDLEGNRTEQAFYVLPLAVGGLTSVGNFMLAQDGSGAWSTHYIFDINGNLTDSQDWNEYSTAYAWNETNDRVYFFRDGTSPNDLMYEIIDQASGTITGDGETPYHGDYIIRGPIRVSLDDSKVLLGSGDVYDADDLTWQGNVGSLSDALWLDNDELIRLSQSNSSLTLQRSDSSNRTIETQSLTGELQGIVRAAEHNVIVTLVNGELTFTLYEPNNDTDGDGVENTEDAFPTDVAASIDIDNDGYPDSWNEGYSEEDSTTGLTLDVFPEDAACWLDSHDDGSGGCDYSATMPEFVPDEILADAEGMVYLFSETNSKVYTWSTETQQYQNPYSVGISNGFTTEAPHLMAYSEAHRRLYFAYSSGQITYIDLEGSRAEQQLYRLPSSVGGLASVGEYVMAQDNSGAWNSHYVIDVNGNLTDSREWNYYSPYYAWNELYDRVYHYSDHSPRDLHYEEVSQTTGEITAYGESPYHSSSYMSGKISVVNAGTQVLLGSGALHDAESLSRDFIFDYAISAAVDYSDMLIIAREADENWLVELISYDDFSTLASFEQSNSVLNIFVVDSDLVFVQQDGAELTFSVIALGDNDGDVLPAWWEMQYGLSDVDADDAELDLDADGLTNLEEYLLGTAPDNTDSDADGLNDYEEVHTYETSPVNDDTDMDGLNDGDEINEHETDPLNADSDGDGFSDSDEINVYVTDPNDADSVPEAIGTMSESFEGSLNTFWQNTDESSADWVLSTDYASDGSQSLKSGEITHNQSSSVQIEGLFTDGTLSFDAKVSAESCCDKLSVYVNGERLLRISNSDWQNYQLSLSNGENVIEWRYYKDGSVDTYDDAAYIDNIRFE